MLSTFFIVVLCVCVSWLLTTAARRYAIAAHMLDHPNTRSSHSVPTPRGGGVAIVATFVLAMTVLWALELCPPRLLAALLAGVLPVAVVGFMDDHAAMAARWRFSVHIVATLAAIALVGGVPPVPIFGWSVNLGWFGVALITLYMVWMVNLYNFMDGIDGIASIEAITVALGGALTWWLATGTPYWFLPVLFAACVFGFLLWNYPPAKIFMGDAGSGAIGMVIAVFSLWAAQEVQPVFWSWFILIGCFMVDATTTLVRRVRRGDKFNEAHRSHAYQYASRKHGSHAKVSLAVGAINTLWLLPLAIAVALGALDGVVGLIVAYAPLVWLVFHYKAGVRAAQET